MMRKLLTAITLLCAVSAADAQRIEAFRNRLAEPRTNGITGAAVRVTVREADGAAEAVRRADARPDERTINGFRIVIFFGNDGSARAEAEKSVLGFNALYPGIHCGIRYEPPYFKVLAGNCATSEEAVMLLARIRPNFPEAYIMREEIKLSSIVAR